jgi:hypothetical protein
MMNAASLPAIIDVPMDDHDYRYRVWTAAHGVDFDAVLAYNDLYPATTTVNGWNVSKSTTTRQHFDGSGVERVDDGRCTLNVWRGDPSNPTRHPDLDGRKFETSRDADRAAYNAGVLGYFIPERRAFRHGLPTAVTRHLDLDQLLGQRVRIDRDVPGYGRSTHHGVFYSLWHSERLGDVGGMIREEPHGECRGGDTAFTMPYDTTIVTRA